MKKCGRGFRWTLEQDEYLKNNYCNGSIEDIQKFVGRSYSVVQGRARSMGLKRNRQLWADLKRESLISGGKNKKHFVNSDYFKEWSGNMAYVLGFSATDGCVHYRKNRRHYVFSLKLKDTDRYILEKISKDMESTYTIYDQKERNMSGMVIRDQIICNDLISLGIVPRKSLILKCPNIPKEFIADFIRGVIDGDGSVYVKKPRITIVTGSYDFSQGLQKILNDIGIENKIYSRLMKTGNPMYELRINKREYIKKLYNLLYSNSTLYLTRKKQSFIDMGIEDENFVLGKKYMKGYQSSSKKDTLNES